MDLWCEDVNLDITAPVTSVVGNYQVPAKRGIQFPLMALARNARVDTTALVVLLMLVVMITLLLVTKL